MGFMDKIKGMFSRKNKVDASTKEKMSKQGFTYRVTVGDPLAKSFREIDTFGAKKTRDDDGVVWLVNPDKDFKEPFPLDEDYTVRYTKQQLVAEIKKVENTKIKPGENKLNKEARLYELNKLLKALEYQGGSFVKIDKDGVPHILYVRYRTSMVPWKWNIDFNLIHTPPETLTKNVLSTQLEKARKYAQKNEKLLTGGMIVFMFILVAWSGINAFFTLKAYDKVDQSRVEDFENRVDMAAVNCLEMFDYAGDNFARASRDSVNITQSMLKILYPKLDTKPQVTGIE